MGLAEAISGHLPPNLTTTQADNTAAAEEPQCKSHTIR